MASVYVCSISEQMGILEGPDAAPLNLLKARRVRTVAGSMYHSWGAATR